MTVDVDRAQVLAFRLRAHDIGAPGPDPLRALERWAFQDSPPGAAEAALSLRTTDYRAGWLDAALYEDRTAVALYNARTATAILPAGDAAAFGTALLPYDDAGLKAIVGPALPDIEEDYAEPVTLAVAAVSDALDGKRLCRDELHAELRDRLPAELLPWCPGCESHHARRGLLVLAGLHGRLCLAGRSGRQPAFARTDQWTGWDAPAPEDARWSLVRTYLHAYGPSTPQDFAAWVGLGIAHARTLWDALADELTEVRIGDGGAAWLPTEDVGILDTTHVATDLLVLAPGDPILLARDRGLLVPDPVVRKRLFPALNPPGLILSGTTPVGLWRARKKGTRLVVAIERLGPISRAPAKQQLERLAPLRGCSSVEIDWG